MKIGLALGGGGVRGLAHILVLEVLDDLGIKPSIIAGTSIGAIIGAIYSSGVPASEIRERLSRHLILKDDTWKDVVEKRTELIKWLNAFSANFARGGLFNSQGFFRHVFAEIEASTFEELEIPFMAVAADYWTAEEVIFDKGELIPALQASMAVPGVFAPVAFGGRILVDGGIVNILPYDHIIEKADMTIAVDVSKIRSPGKHEIPSVVESILGTFNIMQTAALSEKMKKGKPDIYIQPEIHGIRMLDFSKIEEVFRQAAPAIDELRQRLETIFAGPEILSSSPHKPIK